MVALMLGARLGQDQLREAGGPPDAKLPELFGEVPGIRMLNRTAEDAAGLLSDAEGHLASMGVPYVLGVHAVLMSAVITMLREDGHDDPNAVGRAVSWVPDP